MDPVKLEELIEESYKKDEFPFFVACTAGTTVLGAFDPIESVANVCKKYKLWLHVDAAWGGGCLISRKHKDLMRGVEL
jgi:glutamate/tyrosine decarboxylase-like PLP-dependent enzyme